MSAGSSVITVIRSRQGTKQAFNLTLLTQVQARDNMMISMQYAYEHGQMRFLQGKITIKLSQNIIIMLRGLMSYESNC